MVVLLGLRIAEREQMDLPRITHWLAGASSQKTMALLDTVLLELEMIQKRLPP